MHTFPYSEREGTVASRKGDNVPKAEKERRAALMIEKTDAIRGDYLKSLIGTTCTVLFENMVGDNIYQGYTKNYTPVRLCSCEDIIGKELSVKITAFDEENDCLISTL